MGAHRLLGMKNPLLSLLLSLVIQAAHSQTFTSYFTGDTSDVITQALGGTVLMGGSVENDSAMVWWLKRAAGGDVLVIRASGSNGYNDYLYSDLGQTVNSVETIVCNSRQASFDPYVQRRLKECEALWIAGGDQGRYVNYWKDSPVDSLINRAITERKIAIGGTSAGMAILSGAYFAALNGSVTSGQALANPYASLVSLGNSDFLRVSVLDSVITDTHFDNPDRRGRHLAFLARLYQDMGYAWKGICSEERTAVCIENDGLARIFGNNPSQEFAYFTQVSCLHPGLPQTCQPGQPLTWTGGNGPVLVYKVPGTNQGNNTFNLNDWRSGQGGNWQYWSASNGVFNSVDGAGFPDCSLTDLAESIKLNRIQMVNMGGNWQINTQGRGRIALFDLQGKSQAIKEIAPGQFETGPISPGLYLIRIGEKTEKVWLH